ncbi:hypothetical protein MG293_011276 [Ovis ammon polii]|uniref:Uncharacterized protein n=1 Tax=Ovis ammon polii TaxID=230172 RepID=A0AAD4U6S2_OVIAM|nr:hypothetical protein MG293_011276 [Ovis ammon polii]
MLYAAPTDSEGKSARGIRCCEEAERISPDESHTLIGHLHKIKPQKQDGTDIREKTVFSKMGSSAYQAPSDPPRSNAKGDRISSLQRWFTLVENFMVSPSVENPELSSRPKIVHSLADVDEKCTSQAEAPYVLNAYCFPRKAMSKSAGREIVISTSCEEGAVLNAGADGNPFQTLASI